MAVVRDTSRPVELSRSEAMELVFGRLCNVQAGIDECETVRDSWNSDKRIETLSHELRRMRSDVARAIELVESILDRDGAGAP